MQPAELRRMALFALVSAALLLSALAFASGGSDPEPPPSRSTAPASLSTEVPAWARRTELWARSLASQLRHSARRFLEAFARYEVGQLSRQVKVDLRETATAGFAAQLLEAPPAAPPLGGFLGGAHLARLDFSFVSADAHRALISGELRRGATPEEFSFLFVRRAGRWLASGPGQ